MLFDYPTGSFADRYGRLKIFTIGMVLTGSAIVMIAYSVNISMLYISAILMGIGESQISGTLFPWFVNSLDKVENLQEKEGYILKSNGQVQYSTNIIGILAGFAISFLKGAIYLYKKYGFYEIASYNNSPMNTSIYMKLNI